jgi:hypothetical protein
MPRRLVRALAAAALATPALALLPACTKNVIVSFPGNNAVVFPWKACGQDCVNAFTELEDNKTATGEDCDKLVAHAVAIEGGDPQVSAAALYDSALVLLLRGDADSAADRFARAEALDPDPEYKRLDALFRDSAARYPLPPVTVAPAASSGSAPAAVAPGGPASAPGGAASHVVAPAAAPPATGAAQPAAPPPAAPAPQLPSPASSALLTPR